jgi:hypothetical protein
LTAKSSTNKCPGDTSACAKVGDQKKAKAEIFLENNEKFVSNEPAAITTIYAQPVRLTKGASFTAYPGGPIHFSLKIQNTGQTLRDIEVLEKVSTCFSPPTRISHNGSFQANNQQIVWYFASLGAHKTIELSWDATVCLRPTPDNTEHNGASATVITSEATVKIRSLQLEANSPKSKTQLRPLLTLTNIVDRERAGPGQKVNYTLTVKRQDGGTLNGTIVIRTLIPDYIINPNPMNEGQLQGNEIVFDIVNTASAEDDWGQRVEAQATVTVLAASADFSITANPDTPAAGSIVSFTVSVVNTSQFDLDNLEIRIPIPNEIIDPISINDGGQRVGNEIVWGSNDLGTVGPGASKVVTWAGTVAGGTPSGTKIRIEATLTAEGLYEGALVIITVN